MIYLVVLLMLLKPIFPVVEYAVNYDYISKVLCVNKDKPKLKCNGKCHLMKELAKAAESEKPNPSDKRNTTQEVEILFFQEINTLFVTTPVFYKTQKTNSAYSNLYTYKLTHSVFHPPTFVV